MGQKSSKIKITDTDKAIFQLKVTKDELHKYSKRIDKLIQDERLQLKELIISGKVKKIPIKENAKAKFLLKRIHYQQHLLEQCFNQLINLENMVATLEFKLVEKQFIEKLKKGHDILKMLNKEFTDIDKLMDDVNEQISYQEEIDNMLSHSIVGTSFDKELEYMDKKIETSTMEFPSIKELPSLTNGNSSEITDYVDPIIKVERTDNPMLA